MIIHAPDNHSVKCTVELPSSKSISNRLLIMQHLCGRDFNIKNLSDAGDTKLLMTLLCEIKKSQGSTEPVLLDCANAGTVFRFLTAVLSITPGNWVITGSGRMKQRPVGVLAEALHQLGGRLLYLEQPGFPPLSITGTRTFRGGTVHLPGNISSQFISALMMIAPCLQGGLELDLEGDVVSEPYINMTADLMVRCGVAVQKTGNLIKINEGAYSLPGSGIQVEPDWSSAAFWYEIAALSANADIDLPGLKAPGIQGDSAVEEIFSHLGVKTLHEAGGIRLVKSNFNDIKPFNYDFSSCPDLAQAVAVTCAGLNISAKLSGLSGLIIKETDRLSALCSELSKAGYKVHVENSSELIIDRQMHSQINEECTIETYGDHRMAMAFAPLASRIGGIEIIDPEVVAKSYPGFWNDLEAAGFRLVST